jgi:uncharacterized phage protein (TIGR01671 family)
MRKIKFKAWDKLEKRMILPEQAYQGHYVLSLDGRFYNLQNGSGGDDYIVLQCTSLQDKNGNDIYEGDIVKFHEAKELSADYYLSSLYLFDFHEGSFLNPQVYDSLNGSKYVKREPNASMRITGRAQISGNSFFDFKTAEIVGNIFENRQLLNE